MTMRSFETRRLWINPPDRDLIRIQLLEVGFDQTIFARFNKVSTKWAPSIVGMKYRIDSLWPIVDLFHNLHGVWCIVDNLSENELQECVSRWWGVIQSKPHSCVTHLGSLWTTSPRVPSYETIFSKLSGLFQHVASQSCEQRLDSGAMVKLVTRLENRYGQRSHAVLNNFMKQISAVSGTWSIEWDILLYSLIKCLLSVRALNLPAKKKSFQISYAWPVRKASCKVLLFTNVLLP